MSKSKGVLYPPGEVLNPIIGKTDYDYIILWMLNNNEYCEWSDFVEEISVSTLSDHLKKLKHRGFVEKPVRNKYVITPEGRERFNELVYDKKIGKRRIQYPPKAILRRRNYDHWILWMLFNNYSCKWSDFREDPLSINPSSLSNNINSLLADKFIIRENKEYIITSSGKAEYFTTLKQYDLDRQSILEQESRRIEEFTEKTSDFFNRYNIDDRELKFRYIDNVLKFNYSEVESTLKDEEDFNKILLFLALNHPDQYPNYVSPVEFSTRYAIDIETLKYYVHEIVEKQFFKIKIFKIEDKENHVYYFQKNEPIEKILNATVEKYITKFTYLNKFQDNPNIDIEVLLDKILSDICASLFNNKLEIPLKNFLPDYIQYLAYKIESETTVFDSGTKLEGFVWQNIYEEFQTFKPSAAQSDSISIDEYFYAVEKEIFDVLDIVYLSKLYFLNTKEVQEIYSLKRIKNFDDINKLIYRNKVLKAKRLYQNNDDETTDLHDLILKDLITTAENEFYESINITTDIIEKHPSDFIGYLLQSITYFLLDDFENSLKIINDGLLKAPNILLFCQKMQVLIKLHKEDNLIEEIEEMLSKNSTCVPLLRIKYIYFVTHWSSYSKTLDDPLFVIDSAIKLNPNDEELKILKSLYYFLTNAYKEGKRYLIEEIDFNIFEKNPKIDLSASFLLVFFYTSHGKYDKAIKISNQVLDIYPNHPLSHVTKSLVEGYNLIYKFKYHDENFEKFLESINSAISHETLKYKKVRYLLLQTNVLHGIKHVDEALNTINTAIEIIPDLCTLQRKKILLLSVSKREEEALDLLDDLIGQDSELKKTLYHLKSHILFKMTRYEEGLKTCNELIELLPKDLNIVNNKVMFLAHLGKIDEALKSIENLIKLNPDCGNYYDTYGEIYFIMGDYENAIKKYEEALRIEPKSVINFHSFSRLGICYQKIENYKKALEYFEKGKILSERASPAFRELYLHDIKKYQAAVKLQMKQSQAIEPQK